MPCGTLLPNYQQVDAFSTDDVYLLGEGSDVEEVLYITLDLGSIEPTLLPSSSAYRLIGLDTETPYLQLSGTIFQGKHDKLLGTELLFSEAKDGSDPSKKRITHLANTDMRIRFREVELKIRGQEGDVAPSDDSTLVVRRDNHLQTVDDDMETVHEFEDSPKRGKGGGAGRGKRRGRGSRMRGDDLGRVLPSLSEAVQGSK